MPERYIELPLVARRFLETLTDERVVQITEAADLIRDLQPGAREFLEQTDAATLKALKGVILRPELVKFLNNAEPVTINFLSGMRDEEVGDLKNGVAYARAFRLSGRFLKFSIGIMFATTVGAVYLFDKFSAWLNWSKGIK